MAGQPVKIQERDLNYRGDPEVWELGDWKVLRIGPNAGTVGVKLLLFNGLVWSAYRGTDGIRFEAPSSLSTDYAARQFNLWNGTPIPESMAQLFYLLWLETPLEDPLTWN